jgi:YidC/Oxa1 family membrane protein insertase
MAQQQKIMIWVLPLVFGVSGVIFPIGVLIYWTTSNLWTMGQQFYVIRNNPAPGSEGFKAKQLRDEEKARRKGKLPIDDKGNLTDSDSSAAPEPPKPPQRQQPKKQTRSQRRKSGGKPANNKPSDKAKPKKDTPTDTPRDSPSDTPGYRPDDSPSSKGDDK